MRLSVATNFDPDLPRLVAPYGAVELFGKLQRDTVGGGRAGYMLAPTSRARLEDHVCHCHDAGLAFNYLINTACMGNEEFTRSGQKHIVTLLDWLYEIGVDWVTVSIPYLVELVKTRYPRLKVKLGVFAAVDTPKKAEFYEKLGVDSIALQSLVVNRDFERLRAIRRAVKCDLQLIVNSNCLLECPMTPYHNVGLSHASQVGSKGFYAEYCLLHCLVEKLENPVNYIKSPWIRPEDLHHYESIGYSSFKVLERDAPTATLVQRVRAYKERTFDGNLLDLVQCYGYKDARSKAQTSRGRFWDLKEFIKPWKIDPVRLLPLKELAVLQGMIYARPEGESPVYICNANLDGFIDRFVKDNCLNLNCGECRYCDDYASKAVRVDTDYRRKCLELAGQLLSDMRSGRMWGSGVMRGEGGR